MVTDVGEREPTQRRERTRQRLMDAAAQLFAEVGLEGASVEAICERAGYTRGAFYSNFETKDELFLELAGRVARQQVDLVKDRVQELVSSEREGAPVLSPIEIVQRVLEVSGDGRATILLMSEIRIRALRDPAFATAYLALNEQLVRSVEQMIIDIGLAHKLRFRTTPLAVARLLVMFYEGASSNAAMSGLADAAISACVSDEIGTFVLMLVDPPASPASE